LGSVHPFNSSFVITEDDIPVCRALDIAFDRAGLGQKTTWEYRGDCMSELGIQLISIFATILFVNNAVELGGPIIGNFFEHRRQTRTANEGDIVQSIPEVESEFEAYEGTFDDYDELVVQFGYVSLFVVAFPVIPLLALINNVGENWIDGSKLLRYSQRPHPRGASDIGSWYTTLNILSYFSIMTNVGLAVLNRNSLFAFGDVVLSFKERLIYFLFAEHLLITAKVSLAMIIDDTPEDCDEHRRKTTKVVDVYITSESN